jgi:hypothetical protein
MLQGALGSTGTEKRSVDLTSRKKCQQEEKKDLGRDRLRMGKLKQGVQMAL